MQINDAMTIDERRKYLQKMKPLYLQADRKQQGALLATMEHVTGMHRKSLTRLLNAPTLQRQPRTTARPPSYGADVEHVVITVWENLDYICAERLTPTLSKTAQHLAHFGVLTLAPEVLEQLTTISRATVERMLSRHRFRRFRLPQRGPEQANRLTRGVPMGRIPWDTLEPGHFEVDLVHHNGGSSLGEYLHTLQMVDVATGWSERVAVLGRSQRAMESGFRTILARLPFPVKQLHPDNGSEFFNDHLVRFWGEEITSLKLSRSRPYHKNDNRFVEQKNESLVRHYFGTLRLEARHSEAMNTLYEHMWTYYNLFQPVLHLSEKRVEGDTIHRHWDQAQTPLERLIATNVLDHDAQARLDNLYQQTNPARLRQTIYRQTQAFWQEAMQASELHQSLPDSDLSVSAVR